MTKAERWLPCALVVLAACGDEPNVDLAMDDTTLENAQVNYATDDEFAVLTENGAVKLGLTSDRVYFQASEALRSHVDDEIAEGTKDSDSRLARSITGAVRRGVQSALSFDVDFDLDDIRDVDYRDGEIVFDFVNGDHADRIRNIDMDNEPVTRAFAEADARAFVDAFRRVKAGESLRLNVEAEQPGVTKRADSAGDKRVAPDSGGASF